MKLVGVLLLAVVGTTLATEDSCLDRCDKGFDSKMSCQCDSMCMYYKSCCVDYHSVCRHKTLGDTFTYGEDDDEDEEELHPIPLKSITQPGVKKIFRASAQPPVTIQADPNMLRPTVPTPVTISTESSALDPNKPSLTTTWTLDSDADACSGRVFDSFMQVKNGSIYAFRGNYFFELGKRTVLPGYPKRIEDVWGIKGPIDAAFTRINCQGKTYIFKGNKYWRFEDNVLDEDYPRNISIGFENIPDKVDAAFVIPATSYHGKEKVYFFKGDQYYEYEFQHQPSHEECIRMNMRSPSTLFTRYTAMYSRTWEDTFSRFFSGIQGHGSGSRSITKDWLGIQAPVDAAIAGRPYVSHRRRGNSRRQQNNNYRQDRDQQSIRPRGWERQGWGQRSRQKHSPQWSMDERGMSVGQGYRERYYREGKRRLDWDQDRDQDQDRWTSSSSRQHYDYESRQRTEEQAVQNVYFFRKDLYYRVDLWTKTVDFANPPYPRSIAKYWLGCPEKPGPEKRELLSP